MSKLDEYVVARDKFRKLMKVHADMGESGSRCPPLCLPEGNQSWEWEIAEEAFTMAFDAAPNYFWLKALSVYRAHVEALRAEAEAEHVAEMAQTIKGDEDACSATSNSSNSAGSGLASEGCFPPGAAPE